MENASFSSDEYEQNNFPTENVHNFIVHTYNVTINDNVHHTINIIIRINR